MFEIAARFYQEDPEERTDHVITGVRSLKEVRDLLESQASLHKQPWGVVNLVVHGNALGRLDLPIDLHGGQTTFETLQEAWERRDLQPLPDRVLDEHSEIRIQGCAIGHQRNLLQLLSQVLGGKDAHRPLVRASLWYTCFQSMGSPHPTCHRYLCQGWTLHYRAGERPRAEALYTRFRDMHPTPEVDLEAALERESPLHPSDAFSYETPTRYTWALAYEEPGRMPLLAALVDQRRWLFGQETFRKGLARNGLHISQFHWKVHRTSRSLAGQEHPVLEATGVGHVRHLFKPIVTKELAPGMPRPEQAWDDPRYYASAR